MTKKLADVYLPVEKHTAPPPDGFVWIMRDRWWRVHPEKGFRFFQGFAPQCNTNRSIVERVGSKEWDDDCEVKFFPFMWAPDNCSDYGNCI